jgi:hypothetical protein
MQARLAQLGWCLPVRVHRQTDPHVPSDFRPLISNPATTRFPHVVRTTTIAFAKEAMAWRAYG